MLEIKQIHACTGHNAALYALARGRSDRHFLSAGGDGWIVEWSLDEPETGRVQASVDTQVFSLCTLEPGRRVVAGNMNGGVHWIDFQYPEQTRNFQHHKKGVYALVSFESSLFSAGGEGVLTRWDPPSGRSLESLQLSHQALRALDVSGKRREIAVGASDQHIYLLDADTLAIKHKIKNAHSNSVFCLRYHPDGRHLLSGGRDAMLRVWDLEAPESAVSAQAAHWYTLNDLVFSPDGALFASASRDKTLKIWDASNFELLKVVDTIRYGGHIRSVNRLLWLPDALVSAGDDRAAMIWSVSVQ